MLLTRPSRLGAFASPAALLLAVANGGCYGSGRSPTPVASDPEACLPPGCIEWAVSTGMGLDLLVMVDDSGSMEEEQRALREQLPRLVGVLASGDLELGRAPDPGAGIRDFDPVGSLHVGVISSDMGTGGFAQMTCDEPLFGDDGVLQRRGNQANDPMLDCDDTYDRFLSFANPMGTSCMPDENGDLPLACQRFADEFACISALGIEGCGFEQQLESVLKALMPDTPECTQPYCDFFRGERGHGTDATTNGGFLRDDSLLAILVLTDEEDCSAKDPDLFDPRSTRYFGPLGLRCAEYADTALHPIDRYVDGLLSLRSDPSLVVYGVIAGVSPELVRDTSTVRADGTTQQDFDRMLGSASLVARPTADNTGLMPSCTSANGSADPPRRLVQLAQELERRGASSVVQSICEADFSPAFDRMLERIAERLEGPCLSPDLVADDLGLVPCRVRERLPMGVRCDELPGRTAVELGDDGRELCEIVQRTGSDGAPGWFLAPGDRARLGCGADPRLAFTAGAEPRVGSELRVECALE